MAADVRAITMKLLMASCAAGILFTAMLHALAIFGIVFGNDVPLRVLSPVLFLNFFTAVFRWSKKHPDGIEMTKLRLPRYHLVSYSGLIVYGFLFSVVSSAGKGRIEHFTGDVLSSQKAAFFYGLMLMFFSLAMVLHHGLSEEEKTSATTNPL